MVVVLTKFNIRHTILSSHIGKGWNLFPLFRGYLQLRTNLNVYLSMVVLVYIISVKCSKEFTRYIQRHNTSFSPLIFHICFSPQYLSIVITYHRFTVIVETDIIDLYKMVPNELNNLRGHYPDITSTLS